VNEKNKNNTIAVPATNMEQNFRNEFSGQGEITPYDSPCSIHLHSKRKRLTDADGVSGKAAIDGLVHARVFIDDSPEYVQEVSYSQEKIKKGEAEETLIMTMIYDKENLADDERNSKMSDLAQDNDLMSRALHDIFEIWAGSDGVICSTDQELYLLKLCMDMSRCAAKALK